MAVTTYMDLIEQMKALADKINKHYDSVTLETEIPIEDEKTRILREAGILEDEETDIEGLASRAIAAVTDLAQEAGAEMNVSVSTGDDEMPPSDDGEYHTELGDEDDYEAPENESAMAEETEAQSDEEETIEEVESAEEYEKDRIREQLDIISVENDDLANVTGTGRRGEIKARYDDLVRMFGEPTKSKERGDRMDKTNAEWYLEFEVRDADDPEDTYPVVATIYDWKYPELPLDEVQWNVGGKTWQSYEAVTDYIDSQNATTESDEGTDLQRLMKLAGTK